jgi:zinc transport system substrate-binding protein
MAYFAIFLLGIGWWGANVYADEPLPVFVSILPQKYFVERVGGEWVQVSVMVGPGQSPETYEPTPQQIAKLARASLYFRIGFPFEDRWLKSMRAANPALKLISCWEGIPLLPTAETIAIDGATKGSKRGADPHIWTSPPLVKIMAARIKKALAATAPAHRHEFERNYQAFIQDLEQLDQYIHHTLTEITRRRFMVFHPAWGYFASTYGLEEIAIEQAGKEPGAKTLALLMEQARRENIQTIFAQKQFSRSNVETVARAIGAEVVTLDPLAEDYISNLRQVTLALAEALR